MRHWLAVLLALLWLAASVGSEVQAKYPSLQKLVLGFCKQNGYSVILDANGLDAASVPVQHIRETVKQYSYSESSLEKFLVSLNQPQRIWPDAYNSSADFDGNYHGITGWKKFHRRFPKNSAIIRVVGASGISARDSRGMLYIDMISDSTLAKCYLLEIVRSGKWWAVEKSSTLVVRDPL